MGLADLHIHSTYSYDGTSTIPAILKYVSDRTQLNVIAITDHDTTSGVAEALKLAPAYGIEVIPGCEVSTAEGHLLTLFIDLPIQAGLSLVQTVLAVGRAGGLCVAAHPTARGTHSLSFDAIQNALKTPGVAKILVGIEVFNGGLVYTRSNPIVAERARHFPLAQMGNSDAHILPMIGHGASEFAGNTAAELREAMVHATTVVHEGSGLNGFGVISSYLPRFLLRKLGWATWNASPQAPLTYIRLARLTARAQTVRGSV